jgi:TolB-like protein
VPTVSEKSIAVLPFADMSEKKDQEYFADGMAEEIISVLVKVPDLHVPAQTSSFYFKGKSKKAPDIARDLGVANGLEGGIKQASSEGRLAHLRGAKDGSGSGI